MKMRKLGLSLGAALLLSAATVAPAGAHRPDHPNHPGTMVWGGFVNDAPCVLPISPELAGTSLTVECYGTTLWNGGLNGRTLIHLEATIDEAFRVTGRFEDILIGTYIGDGSTGSLAIRGTFSIDANRQFVASGRIVEASCDWAGSTGHFEFVGTQFNGGYEAEWHRPPTSPDPTCVPVNRLPDASGPT